MAQKANLSSQYKSLECGEKLESKAYDFSPLRSFDVGLGACHLSVSWQGPKSKGVHLWSTFYTLFVLARARAPVGGIPNGDLLTLEADVSAINAVLPLWKSGKVVHTR